MTLTNGKLALDKKFVIRVTKLLFFFEFRVLESAPSVRSFVCTYETTRTPFNGVL